MNKLKILYFTLNWSNFTYKPDHYFKLELAKLPDVHVHFREKGGDMSDILAKLNFVPDFIYFDDFDYLKDLKKLPTGLNKVNIPKGVLFHDVHRTREVFSKFATKNHFDLIFVHYRDAFIKYFPELKDRSRWLPNHVYEPIFHNYHLEKKYNYLMMGKISKLYPLREKMYRKMRKVDGFVCHGHPGYNWLSKKESKSKLIDEKYAMEISRAKLFLTCGSKYNYAVGKYFEVPACGTLLLAPGFSELRDLGFVDKETFVKVNKNNFVDMAKYYLKHKKERNEIIQQANRLVQSRHTTAIRVREFVDELWRYTGKPK